MASEVLMSTDLRWLISIRARDEADSPHWLGIPMGVFSPDRTQSDVVADMMSVWRPYRERHGLPWPCSYYTIRIDLSPPRSGEPGLGVWMKEVDMELRQSFAEEPKPPTYIPLADVTPRSP
jgi:hypothetical protein